MQIWSASQLRRFCSVRRVVVEISSTEIPCFVDEGQEEVVDEERKDADRKRKVSLPVATATKATGMKSTRRMQTESERFHCRWQRQQRPRE